MSTKFSSLKIQGWRQFGEIEVSLHPQITILTGANGAGKSSILKIFSRHFGMDYPFLATPMKNRSGGYSYFTGLFSNLFKIFQNESPHNLKVGTLRYQNNAETSLNVPHTSGVQYHMSAESQQEVHGIHIDSAQTISPYQQVGQIPTNIINATTAYQNYNSELQRKYQGSHSQFSPIYRMKEAIIAMALFGEGNNHVQGNEEVLETYKGFVVALRNMLPESLGFIDISVRTPEIVLVTETGEFLLDSASGGITTIIDLTWRLFMFSKMHEEFVVTIDEPENHLHPSMQRTLIRKLVKTFPQAQFIVATHSPFIVSSVKDSNVYALRYISRRTGEVSQNQVMPTTESKIVSIKLDAINKAGSASEILRDVLGLSATIPEWVEVGLQEIIQKYKSRQITKATLEDLRADLKALGYEELYPAAISGLVD